MFSEIHTFIIFAQKNKSTAKLVLIISWYIEYHGLYNVVSTRSINGMLMCTYLRRITQIWKALHKQNAYHSKGVIFLKILKQLLLCTQLLHYFKVKNHVAFTWSTVIFLFSYISKFLDIYLGWWNAVYPFLAVF